jgi:hypothetical protein
MNQTQKLVLYKLLLVLVNLSCLALIFNHSYDKYARKSWSDKNFMSAVFLSTDLFFVNAALLWQFYHFNRYKMATFQKKQLVGLLIAIFLMLYIL